MKFDNWIKRKYPNHYVEILKEFNNIDLEFYLKKLKYKVGVLTIDKGDNRIGDLVLYHRSKEYGEEYNGLYHYDTGWTGNYDINYKFAKDSGMVYDQCYSLFASPI